MSKSTKYALFGILVVAALLRLLWLSLGDPTTDEVLIAFRAMEMYDFDEGGDQPTPLEWFDPHTLSRYCIGGAGNSLGLGNVPTGFSEKLCDAAVRLKISYPVDEASNLVFPWWTYLSFHDHPPLAFLSQYVSMKIFGDTNFGFRLPSALFGIGIVWLLYGIGRELYSKDVGLLAALFGAVTVNAVYISRTGLQEASAIFFMMLALYLFIKSLRKDVYFVWTGGALGMALLAKYTTGIMIPVFLAYLLFFRRDLLRNIYLWVGALLVIFIFSPVIAYNIGLYQAVGHFDFQISHIFGQETPLWQIQPGKAVGTPKDRLLGFVPTLLKTQSYVFLGLFVFTCAAFFVGFAKSPKEVTRRHALLIFSLLFIALFIIGVIGNWFRFASMLTPFLVLAVAVFVAYTSKMARTSFFVVLGAAVLFEVAYSVNSQVYYLSEEKTAPWTHSQTLRWEKYNGGYNELGEYLKKELAGKRPAQTFEMNYVFLDRLHERAITRQAKKELRPFSVAVIYDKNVDHFAQLWVLDRLNIYHAWPVMDTQQYVDFAVANGYEDLTDTGFEHYYFIRPTDAVYQRRPESRTEIGAVFEELLLEAGAEAEQILNQRGEVAFLVYTF